MVLDVTSLERLHKRGSGNSTEEADRRLNDKNNSGGQHEGGTLKLDTGVRSRVERKPHVLGLEEEVMDQKWHKLVLAHASMLRRQAGPITDA